jgi:riboflavin biosynthesis pyrimidine reductase
LFPATPNDLSYRDLVELYAYPAEGPWVRANFVTSIDGAAQGSDQRSASLSSRADKRVFALLRTLADVILVGASTARAEAYLPVVASELRTSIRRDLGLAPLPSIAVVSRSLHIDPTLLSGGEAPTIVVTTQSAPERRRQEVSELADVIVAGDVDVDLGAAVEALAGRGFPRMLCEGGPTLLGSLVAAGRVDEICLTMTPVVVSGDSLRMAHGAVMDPATPFALRHLLEDDSQLFLRYTQA